MSIMDFAKLSNVEFEIQVSNNFFFLVKSLPVCTGSVTLLCGLSHIKDF